MYDFKSLSPDDLELLVRDLLQKHLGVCLEAFKPGRDSGIDLRHAPASDGTLIVQCKHYANTDFRGLLRSLQGEVPKVQKLSPARYCVATSFPLSPLNKNQIVNLFHHFCKTPQDVFGKEDLNNLLGQHPTIEKQHIKLWLTSSAVLNRLLHSGLYNQSALSVERIRSKAKYYVQNESFVQALDVIKGNNYCVISGIPGIGKTFLAEVLLLYFLEKGYEPFKVVSHISEAWNLLDASTRQVFFYDDFLGQTGLEEKLGKNEEQSILAFIEYVRGHTHAMFLLTTREYILQRARQTYEKLHNAHFDQAKCIIELQSYTRRDRAKILFNHIYFSSLPTEHIRELTTRRHLLPIIDHKNYSPRIVEWMTDLHQEQGCRSADYAALFLATLSDPTKLWHHGFTQHISPTSRNVLLVMMTFRFPVSHADLNEAFNSYMKAQVGNPDHSINPSALQSSLEELEGSFLRYDRDEQSVFITFHNPSVLDFLESYLSQDSVLLRGLFSSIVFYDQFLALCQLRGGKPEHEHITKVLGRDERLLVDVILRSVSRTASSRILRKSSSGKLVLETLPRNSIELNIVHGLRAAKHLSPVISDDLVKELLALQCNRIRMGAADMTDIPKVVRAANDLGRVNPSVDELITATVEYFQSTFQEFQDLEEFEAALEFERALPGSLPPTLKRGLRAKLKEDSYEIFDWRIGTSDDEAQLSDLQEIVRNLEGFFDLDLDSVLQRTYEREEELKNRLNFPTIDDFERPHQERAEASNDEIMSMFDCLEL